jgi:phosphohistidine phosphatase
MELILWRHAEAEPNRSADPGDQLADRLRVLTPKGARHASRVGAFLDRQLPAQCRILASPATRCVQTAEALGRKFGTSEALAIDSSPEAVLDASGWPGQRVPVVLVGHQPLLGQVAALILSGTAHEWKVRKAGVLWIARKSAEEPAPFIRLAVGPDMVGKLR